MPHAEQAPSTQGQSVPAHKTFSAEFAARSSGSTLSSMLCTAVLSAVFGVQQYSRQYFVYSRTLSRMLPTEAVAAPPLEMFKAKLDGVWWNPV